MNRNEFMQRLEALLEQLPASERTEALKYYTDYFDEAGSENEEQVLCELGSPEEVAKNIMADSACTAQAPAVVTDGQGEKKEDKKEEKSSANGYVPPQNNGWKTALIVLLCIFLIPIGFPILIGVVSTVFSLTIAIFSCLFGLIIGLAAAAVALFAAAVVLIIIASANLAALPFASFILYGVSLFAIALGILFVILVVLLCGKALPAIFKGIVYICGLPFRKKEVIV